MIKHHALECGEGEWKGHSAVVLDVEELRCCHSVICCCLEVLWNWVEQLLFD